MAVTLPRALVFALGLAAAVAGCGTARPGPAGPGPSPVRHSAATPACPKGSPLPPGEGNAVDYVDFFEYHSRFYLVAPAGNTGPVSLGSVVTRVRCTLTTASDRRQPPPVVDGTAAFLPAGTPVYAVAGYSPRCRLAAYLGGRLHVYLAQRRGVRLPTPLPCATATPRG